MRRSLAAAALGMTVSVLASTSVTSSADPGVARPGDPQRATATAAPSPRAALRAAEAVLGGEDRSLTPVAEGREATLVLRDLFVSLPRLSASDRTAARTLLARPSQGRRLCGPHVCVHWNSSGGGAATAKWARQTLKVMNGVWRKEVGDLGYRAPASDRGRGGNSKLDVYLKDVGGQGLYGYCDPEWTVPGAPRRASGYCVLDNDFARSQFRTRPLKALKVTAAHEFFHASQFNYDYKEDGWFMEATATWMEERYADSVNDNRQYLRDSQVHRTFEPLDTFTSAASNQYGNWIFFEFLSSRYGKGVVKSAWAKAVGKRYSTEAVKAALPSGLGFRNAYSRFAAANTTPARSYAEGGAWPHPESTVIRIGQNQTGDESFKVDHMANELLRLIPRDDVQGRRWHLRVSVDGPLTKTDPAAALVIVRRSGAVDRTSIKLDDAGVGDKTVPFNRASVQQVHLALVNASTRFRCAADNPTYSCTGNPVDDGKTFAVTLEVFRTS